MMAPSRWFVVSGGGGSAFASATHSAVVEEMSRLAVKPQPQPCAPSPCATLSILAPAFFPNVIKQFQAVAIANSWYLKKGRKHPPTNVFRAKIEQMSRDGDGVRISLIRRGCESG